MAEWKRVRIKCVRVFVDQFLLISYAIAALIALTWPAPGKAVAHVEFHVNDKAYQIVKILNIMTVFLISGAMLETDDIKKAWRHRLGVAFGFLSTLAITPCLGFVLRAITLTPDAFTAGLTLTTAVPQTLGIGISLVRSCGSNEGLALMLTAGTNIIGIFTMPLWLKALFDGTSFELSIDMVSLLVNLIISVLVPSLVGKAAREMVPSCRQFVTKYKVLLSLFSTFNLAFIVWQVLSSAQSVLMEQPFVGVVYVVMLSAGQHVVYLIFNFLVTTLILRLPAPENVATGIMASQKSGPVAVAVIGYITDDLAEQGLLAIPAVLGQLVQVFIGSALVPLLSRVTQAYKRAQQVAAEEAQEAMAAEVLEGGTDKAVALGSSDVTEAAESIGPKSSKAPFSGSTQSSGQEAVQPAAADEDSPSAVANDRQRQKHAR